MNVSDESTVSLWAATEAAPDAAPLERNENVDVVVVGSGIAGMSVAYELAVAGQKVAILDRGRIGSGMTARTTAHLSSVCDDHFSELIKLRGEELARIYYQSQSTAIDRIQSIQDAESIACDFRRLDGFLFPASGKQESDLERELNAGLKFGVAVEKTRGLPFAASRARRPFATPTRRHSTRLTISAGWLPASARVAAASMRTQLSKRSRRRMGVCAHPPSPALLSQRRRPLWRPIRRYDRVALHTKQAPYRTYAMSFEIARDVIPDSLCWGPAVIAQLLVLWAWHAPPALHIGMQSHVLHLIILASLLTCALWFWLAILSIKADHRWRAILALLITSKLFCLLGVLLVFAPRVLYPDLPIVHPPGAMHQIEDALADQQLAGLFMLVACPATYVLAGIVIAARWFFDLDDDDASDRQVPTLAVREARHVG